MKKLRGFIYILLAGLFFLNGWQIEARAATIEGRREVWEADSVRMTRATNSFSVVIPADSILKNEDHFTVVRGETVRINANYSPEGSVDFGIIDDEGIFYYINVSGGDIDETILIETSGDYTFAIRNNSSEDIKVNGFINY